MTKYKGSAQKCSSELGLHNSFTFLYSFSIFPTNLKRTHNSFCDEKEKFHGHMCK